MVNSPDTYIILEHFADNSEETELANFGLCFGGICIMSILKPLWVMEEISLGSLFNRGWASPHLVLIWRAMMKNDVCIRI